MIASPYPYNVECTLYRVHTVLTSYTEWIALVCHCKRPDVFSPEESRSECYLIERNFCMTSAIDNRYYTFISQQQQKKKVLKDNVWSPRWNVQFACVTINTNDGRFTIVQQQTLPICCIPPECMFAMSFKPNLFIEIQQATSYSIGQWMSLLISLH